MGLMSKYKEYTATFNLHLKPSDPYDLEEGTMVYDGYTVTGMRVHVVKEDMDVPVVWNNALIISNSFLKVIDNEDVVPVPSTIKTEEGFITWLQEDPSMEYIVDTLDSLIEIVELNGMHDYPEYHRAKSLVQVLEKKYSKDNQKYIDLLKDIYYNYGLPNSVDQKIEKLLGDLL